MAKNAAHACRTARMTITCRDGDEDSFMRKGAIRAIEDESNFRFPISFQFQTLERGEPRRSRSRNQGNLVGQSLTFESEKVNSLLFLKIYNDEYISVRRTIASRC